jgi:ABC-type cobalt transport system substrate-binding protein
MLAVFFFFIHIFIHKKIGLYAHSIKIDRKNKYVKFKMIRKRLAGNGEYLLFLITIAICRIISCYMLGQKNKHGDKTERSI